RVGCGLEGQLAKRDGACRDKLARRDRDAIEEQLTGCREAGDLDRLQTVGWAVVRIAEAEVGGRERISRVLVDRGRSVRSSRSIVDGIYGDGAGVDLCLAATGACFAMVVVGEGEVGRAVEVAGRREHQAVEGGGVD